MEWQGFALVLSGALFHALYNTINKKLLVANAPDECISTINFLGSGTLLLLLAYMVDPPTIDSWFTGEKPFFWALCATSILNIVILFGNVKALNYGDVSLISPISATQPMIVMIPSWIILNEWPGAYGYWGLLLLAVGMYVFAFGEQVYVTTINGKKIAWQPPAWIAWTGKWSKYFAPWAMLFRNRGVQIALLSAVCGAVAINFDKLSVLRTNSFLFPPACILLFCGIIGMVKTISENTWNKIESKHIKTLAINPIVFALVLILYWTAFEYGFAAYVGALKRTQVIFALLLGFYVLHEKGAKNRWAGATVMALGAAAISLD